MASVVLKTETTITVAINPHSVLGLEVDQYEGQVRFIARSRGGAQAAAAQIRSLLQRIEKDLDAALEREK